MLTVTKIFLSGIVSVTSLLFIMEIGYFSQCTPMNIDNNMLSPEEMFVYVSIECGKSPVIMFMFIATYLFTAAFSFFSYYVLKWANVPSFIWYLVEIPLILSSVIEIYYHHRILKENGYPVLENESARRYIEIIALSHEYGCSCIMIMAILMLISFVYKKKKSKETEEKND